MFFEMHVYEDSPGPGGQACILQESVFSFEPEQEPPLLSNTVLSLVNFWDPPPQLLEHEPFGVQSDH